MADDAGSGAYPHALALLTYGVLERAVGARYLSTADWLRDFTSWSDERRAAWQRQRLTGVLRDAAEQVPFYREVLSGSGPPSGIDLATLPVVDKARIRQEQASFMAAGWNDMPHIGKRTGGSTGDPWHYVLDRRAWAQLYAAAIHQRERIGHRYGEPVVLLGAPTSLGLEKQSWKSRLRRRLERQHAHLTGFDVDRRASTERVRRAGLLGAPLWYGYAGTIAAMADAVLEDGMSVTPPRAIITTAEVLQPARRRRIENAFGVDVFDEYGCNDGGVLAQTCRSGRFHVAENVSIVEVLDGERPCPPGEEGDVVVTNLHARALPFLRYRTGDRAVLGEGRCPCGLAGATLERVVGRAGDQLELPSGARLTALAFGPVFMRTRGVRQWQVVQRDPWSVTVRLAVDREFDESQAAMIRDYFTRQCRGEVEVRLTTDEPLDRSRGGKFRVVVRDVAGEPDVPRRPAR